ncbi:RNA-directed DNA polymerase, eukaryota, reverse transcriptase zinc-binding domain protein [Tanacetum coccineum]
MYVKIVYKSSNKIMFCTSIYASNSQTDRRMLWEELGLHKNFTRGSPWNLMGDFNVALNLEDYHSGPSSLNSAMNEFKDCVAKIEVMDVNASGLHYTWNQKPRGGGGVLKKLDRIMGNMDFIDSYPGAFALFQPYRISDHSPAVLKIPTLTIAKPKPFKFFNFITFKERLLGVVSEHWKMNTSGHFMFQVVSKLKVLKKPMRKLVHDRGNLHDRVNRLRVELDEVQKDLYRDPDNSILRDEEFVYVKAFSEAQLDEERFLKQKAKIDWLEAGDSNSAYFHKSVKSRNQRSRIDVIRDANNVEALGALVADAFVSHYYNFLGTTTGCEGLNVNGLFANKVSDASNLNIIRPVSYDEIRDAMFSIGDDRAPGPEGYSSAFFKKSWDIVSSDICRAIHDFFSNGQLLKEINHTFIALIPKVSLYHGAFGFMACVKLHLDPFALTVDIQAILRGVEGCVDDLFIFARGDVDSARLIMEAFDEFQRASRLTPSIPKSTVYFCNVRNYVKQAILNIMPFAEGELPVKYLGVPLISSRLLNKDCKVLQHMRGFLWCNGGLKRGKAKVAWDDICLSKCEGGLGLRSLDTFQYCVDGLLTFGICFNKAFSMGKWICVKLRGRSFWDIPIKSNLSWGWLKLLQIRDLVKPFFWSKIGNGRNTSLLFDNWCASSPLSTYLTPRGISREGFNLRTCVADLVAADGWLWAQSWLLKAPNLGLIPVPALRDQIDVVQWKDLNGLLSSFSVRAAWEALRSRGNSVLWYRVVWFSHCIPRHAFHIWLVMRNSLRTQDKLRQWDVGDGTDLNLLQCALCESQKDSHPHLFFECAFSSKVWQLVCHLADLDQVPPRLQDIMLVLQTIAHKRTAKSVIGRLLLAATSYFIWMERNNRLFKKVKKKPGEIRDMVMITVRLKLLTLRFKNKLKVAELLSRWKMPSNFRLYG